MIITREKGMRMWGGGSGSTSASGVNGGGGFSLAVTEGEGTGNAYTGFTYESGVLSLIKGTQFVTTDFFNKLFTAYDANGNAIVPNDTTTAINNLKLLVGTWTEQYLSALGLNSQGGGGGTGDVSHIKVSTNPDVYLDPDSDGIIDMSDYVSTIAERNNWNTANANINRLMARVPSATFNTGNELADKAFVNSSISTATATFRGTVTASNDTDAAAATALATISTKDLNDYAFVKVENTPQTGVDKYKRYKYDGTNWVYEYTLNNSSFTSDQWSAINSGITSAIVSTIVPNTRSITAGTGLTGGGNLQADRTISLATSGVSAGTYRSVTVDVYGRVTAGTNPTTLSGYGITDAKIASGVITLGSNTITPITSISKNSEGILSVVKGTTTDYIDLSHNHSYWEILDRPTDLEGFGLVDELNTNYVTIATNQTITGIKTFSAQVTANGLMLSTTKKIYFGDNSHYIELDSTGFHFSHGIYSDSFVSALGANSSGGGGGGDFSEEQMWAALRSNTGTYADEKINANHIPDTSSLYGYLKASSLNGYATQSWVNSRGFLTSHQNIYALTLKADGTAVTTFTPNSADASLDFVAGANVSLTRGTNKITIANTYSYTLPLAASGTRGGVQIGYSESGKNYAVKLSSEKMYVTVPWENTTYSAGAGISISSGTIINNGVRSITKHSTTAYDILLINAGGTIDYLDLSHQHSYWEILDKPTDLEGFGLTDELNALYVTALGTSGNYLTWTKNGSTNNITIPYSTLAGTATTTADTTNALYVVGVTSSSTTTLKRDTSITIKGNALSAGSITTTGNVSIGGTLGVTGATTLTGLLTANGGIVVPSANINVNGVVTANQIQIQSGLDTKVIINNTDGEKYSMISFRESGTQYLSLVAQNNLLTLNGNLTVSGEVTASSDARRKDIISDTKFNVRDIASARSVLYEWNDGRDKYKKVHGGSIAQDWLGKADSFLSQDNDGFYSINYGALALCSAITIAREVVKHEDEITRLKKEVVKLRERVAELEERRIA